MQSHEVIVVGAGINGLATALALKERGVTSLALLEQYGGDHARGSSHGRSRITRSSYSSPKYVELMQRVHQQLWPHWEELAGTRLLHPNPGIFFGPGVEVHHQSLKQVPAALQHVEVLEPSEASRRFPPFRFPDTPRVLVDHSAAVVAAQRTREFLREQLIGVLREECQLLEFQARPEGIELTTSRGKLRCERLILTLGPWASQKIPLEAQLRAAHQDVAYYQLDCSMQVGDFPCWVYLGEDSFSSFYGLPEFERPGVKIAHHRTGPLGDSPDRDLPRELPEGAAQVLQDFIARQWSGQPRLVGYEPCMYTNTVSEDFVLDHWPGEPRIVVGAGFSGHGFKLAPLTGRVLAELCLDGKTSMPEFEKHRHHFCWSHARSW